jgi:hypothetical protein
MAVQSRRYRMVIVPCLCITLLTWQFFARGNAHASPIDQIDVNRTVSKFVVPLSQTIVAKFEAMSRFANLVAPQSELPERDWLLEDPTPDDSDVLVLATHLSDADIRGAAGETDADASESFLKAAAQFALAAAAMARAIEHARQEEWAQMALAMAAAKQTVANAKAKLAEHKNNENFQAAVATEADAAQAELDEAAAQTQTLAAVEAVTATDEAAFEQALQFVDETEEEALQLQAATNNNNVGAYKPTKSWEHVVQKKRQMMLEFELDAAILAAM